MKVCNISEMSQLEDAARDRFGITEEVFMENAGHAAAVVLRQEIGMPGKRFLVLCDDSVKGGVGLVVARHIHANRGSVKAAIVGDPQRFQGAAKQNFEILARLPIEIMPIESLEALTSALSCCDVIIDGLLGIEMPENIDGRRADIIQAVNLSQKIVVSLNLPSGVNGDTGNILGTAVKAKYTVTFGLPKIGNLLLPGYEQCGKLYVSHLSLPPELYDAETLKIAINDPIMLPPRKPGGHKGTFGDVLFIAGAANYFGAPYFAAASFLKAGGGYSRLAAPAAITPFIANKGSEIVFAPQKETAAGSIALENKAALLELSEKVDMVVIGPGLSLDAETQQLARELAEAIQKPLLLDGDGITAICQNLSLVSRRTAPTILTPHLGEMARITKQSVHAIDDDKITVLQQATRELNAIIVLKGAHSLIGYPDGRVFINLSGNSGMATAGSGDVLTGTIAAMFGLGLSLQDAVRKGVFMHGLSGDLAAAEKGEDGITAQDILEYLPRAVKLDREGLNESLKAYYRGVQIV